MAGFDERKLRALAWLASDEPDRSRKGGIDAPIATLIDRINAHPDFFTTSSCSGRITLFVEPGMDSPREIGGKKKKKGGEWLFVSHEAVAAQEIVAAAGKFVANAQHGELLVFRFEPFILALDCASVAAAQDLVACAIASGFRESGITSIRKRIIVAVRCSIRLEVPVAENGKLLVPEHYLSYLTSSANAKMEQNRQRTNRFLDSFITQFQSGALSSLDTPIQVTNDDHFKAELIEDDQSDSQEFHDLCSLENSVLLSSARQSVCGSGHSFKNPNPFETAKSSAEENRTKTMTKWFDESTAKLCIEASGLRLLENEPLRRWGHSACSLGSRLAIFGGYGGIGRHARLNDLLVLSLPNLELKHLKIKSEISISPRMAHTASVIDDKIWIIGGRRGPNDLLGDVMIVNCDDQEAISPALSGDTFAPRHRHAAATVEDKIYIYGGIGEDGVLGDLYVVDTSKRLWSRLDSEGDIPTARHSHSLCSIGNKLYLYGGFDGKTIYGDVYVLDTSDLRWTRLSTTGELPVPRFSHSCFVLGNCLAVLGGCPTMKQVKSLFVLDLDNGIWRRVELSMMIPEHCLLVRHSATLVQDRLFVIGGGASCYAFGTMFSDSFVMKLLY